MSDRVKRARELRSRRKAGIAAPLSPTGEEAALEVSATSTIACIFLLLSIGASLATSYIMVHNPNCMSGGSGNVSTGTSAPNIISNNNNNLRSPPASSAATIISSSSSSTASASSASASSAATPPEPRPPSPAAGTFASCTADELFAVKKQLPAEGCYRAAYEQACSFTIATTSGGCMLDNTKYYREPMGQISLQDQPFTAVFVGLRDKDETPMDLLVVGSHDKEKYKLSTWRQSVGQSQCLKPEVPLAATKQAAQVLILEQDISKALLAKRWKATAGLTDSDMKGETTQISSTGTNGVAIKTMTQWAETAVPKGDIHFLRVTSGNGDDYNIVSSGGGAGGILERVWYLEFGYDWKGSWGGKSLKPLITSTLASFACYWQGTNGNLWRISGCWLSYYEKASWAQLVCVNTRIEAAKPIYDKMEQVFEETRKKDLKFVK